MSFSQQTQPYAVVCKNPLKMALHYILESSSNTGKYFDRLQYCGVCRALAFSDNSQPTSPEKFQVKPAYSDSKINQGSGPCGCDTL